MEKEVMDALCMLHSLAKKDTTFTTQDEQFKIVIRYITKQQKEIEEKEKTIKILRKTKPIEEVFHDLIKENDYISKDKIRKKIKHYNNELEHIKNGEEFENEEPMYYWGKVALEKLLEESTNE